MRIQFAPPPRRVRRSLLACVGALSLAYAATAVLRFGFGHDVVYGLTRLFDLDQEQNVPSLFSSLQLFACAGVLALLAALARARGDRDVGYWAGLAAVFTFLGLDEAVSIHELLAAPTAHLHAGHHALLPGWFGDYAWVLPYAVLSAAFGIAYLRFLARLPRATAVRFVVAGAAFVAGAAGVEVLEAVVSMASLGSAHHVLFLALTTTTQEVIEMVSITYFLGALLQHLEATGFRIQLGLVPAAHTALAAVAAPRPVLAPSDGGRLRRRTAAEGAPRITMGG